MSFCKRGNEEDCESFFFTLVENDVTFKFNTFFYTFNYSTMNRTRYIFLIVVLAAFAQQTSCIPIGNNVQHIFPLIHSVIDQCKFKAQLSCQQDQSAFSSSSITGPD